MLQRRLATMFAALALTAGLAACGNKQDTVTRGETEGTYLDVGPLKYQVQISRTLNPRDIEDRSYLVGLPAAERDLPSDNVWFAVFIRVENDGKKAAPSAQDFSIETTQDETFTPVALGHDNVFAYRPQNIASRALVPATGSVAAAATTQGALLLFKVPQTSLENRPLEFVVKSAEVPQKVGTVALDV